MKYSESALLLFIVKVISLFYIALIQLLKYYQ